MDFFVRLPQTQRKNDSISLIVDMLKKYAHFIPVKSTYTTEDYVRIYINEIVNLQMILCRIFPSYRIGVLNTLLIFGGLFKKGLVLK